MKVRVVGDGIIKDGVYDVVRPGRRTATYVIRVKADDQVDEWAKVYSGYDPNQLLDVLISASVCVSIDDGTPLVNRELVRKVIAKLYQEVDA